MFFAKQFCLALLLAGAACTTPSVPIPPPEPERVFFSVSAEAGTASFRYEADSSYANAVVYVFNRDVGEGLITTAEPDGSVEPTGPFPAIDGDEVVITFETQVQLSSICLRLQDGQSHAGLECDR